MLSRGGATDHGANRGGDPACADRRWWRTFWPVRRSSRQIVEVIQLVLVAVAKQIVAFPVPQIIETLVEMTMKALVMKTTMLSGTLLNMAREEGGRR